MTRSGDVVTVDFPGVQGLKRRPAVVISTDAYHNARPDVILGLLTTNLNSATSATDWLLRDWQAAGLRMQSAFRSFLATMLASSISVVGHLSDFDWKQVQARLKIAIAIA